MNHWFAKPRISYHIQRSDLFFGLTPEQSQAGGGGSRPEPAWPRRVGNAGHSNRQSPRPNRKRHIHPTCSDPATDSKATVNLSQHLESQKPHESNCVLGPYFSLHLDLINGPGPPNGNGGQFDRVDESAWCTGSDMNFFAKQTTRSN